MRFSIKILVVIALLFLLAQSVSAAEWKNVSTPEWHEEKYTFIDVDYTAKDLKEGETYEGRLYLGGEAWGFGSDMPNYWGEPKGHVKVFNPPVEEYGCNAVIKLVRLSDGKVLDEVTKRIPEHNGLCMQPEQPEVGFQITGVQAVTATAGAIAIAGLALYYVRYLK